MSTNDTVHDVKYSKILSKEDQQMLEKGNIIFLFKEKHNNNKVIVINKRSYVSNMWHIY